MAANPLKNKTNVRLTRWVSRLAEALAPEWVARQAFEAWGRPRKLPARWGAAGEGARRFALEVGREVLAAWEWNVGGTAGTALLVHGWSGNGSQLRAFVEPLVARGFHVLAVDLPAHGESAGSFTTLPAMSDAVMTLGRRLTPRLVVAHSLGATATALALSEGLRVPEVALLSPAVEMPPYVRHFVAAAGLSEGTALRMIQQVETILRKPIESLDLRRRAPRLEAVRALVVHDVDDVVTPHEAGRQLADAWPGARLLETRGLGHDGIRKAALVVEGVLAWVAEGEARAEAPAA
jgi:pimeloyl-ACP methyl ester carboxylesterase